MEGENEMKKRKKQNLMRIISVLLLIVTLVPIIPIVSKAATLYVNGQTSVSYRKLDYYSGPDKYTWIYSLALDDGTKRLAYCIDPTKAGPAKDKNNTTVGLVTINASNAASLGYDWDAICRVAKVISFGYHGEGSGLYEMPDCADLSEKYYPDSDRRYLITHIAAGFAMTGSWAPLTSQEAIDNHIVDFYNDCQSMEVDMSTCEIVMYQQAENFQRITAISAWPVFEQGQITVQKKGEILKSFTDGKFVWEDGGLPGVKFKIYAAEDIMDTAHGTVAYPDGTLVDTLTTGNGGSAVSKQLWRGKYKVVETATANPQYQYVKVEKNVTITAADLNPKVSVYNDRTRWELKINKVNDSNEPLSGGKFNFIADEDIKNAYGKVIVPADTILATCSAYNGSITPNLDFPYGCKWRMEEVEAVPGHYKNENPLHATLKPDEDPEMKTREFTTEDGKKGLYFLFKYLDKEFPHFAYIDFEI